MDNRILTASFGVGESGCVTSPLYQYNYGNELHIVGLELPDAFEVHFSNDQYGQSSTSIGTFDGEKGVVAIPDEYLANGGELYAWIYLHDTENDGETVYQIMTPIIARAEITDYEPTPAQQDVIEQGSS